ncbi:uncharacterized protein LOC115972945 [Quercus lobata]|uniref:uncharacterized protein LOC115972945 n=1 Tax=Quercus lobata TaxID=97700 RepID=UPI001245B605|nr:uncharacterized protein LOC115972945 [Quercus lobata]
MAAHRCDSIMADTDSDRDSGMAESDSDEYDSEVELEIATAYVQLCIEYVQKYYMKRPMCTSILSGRSYVIEVLEGNPQVCYDIFHMDKTIFKHLCNELKRLHLLEEDTGWVSVEESVGTVLFIVRHNVDYRVTANRFQHSLETIQRRFRRTLHAIHALGCIIIRPDVDAAELPQSLRGNGKYYPWFEKCVGAIDGTHISASAPSGRTTAFTDRRSDITQNVMCACNFDMRFTYVHTGWEGSANDARVMQDALGHAECEFLWLPRGSYYLVDSGYAIGSAFLPPHKSTCYHAQEFRGANQQPSTPQELFNYRHSSLRMVIERCFGVLKARFPILTGMHSFSISRQRLIVTTFCALHNFIRMYNRADEMFHVWEGSFVRNSDANLVGAARVGSGGTEEAFNSRAQRAMSEYRDVITAAMWADYIVQ